MFSITKTTTLLATLATLATAGAALGQSYDDALGATLMAADGSANESIAAATGWHICSVNRTGAGWGNHYVAMTCPTGPFSNKWHILEDGQKDAMLATALSAATSNNDVQVYIGPPVSGYNQVRAIYLNK